MMVKRRPCSRLETWLHALPYLWLFKKRNTKTTTTTKKRNNKTLDLRAKTTLFINRFFFGILNDEKLCTTPERKKKRILGWWNGQTPPGAKGKAVECYFLFLSKRGRKIPTYWFLLGSELLYRSRGPWRDASYRWESPGNFRPLVTIRLEGSIEKYLLKSAGIHIITIVRKKKRKKKKTFHIGPEWM